MAVATSGGRDSTALLHATVRAARAWGLEVVALHVHHGLLPQADDWVRHLRSQVQRWRRTGAPVTLRVTRLSGAPAAGESVEAWARTHRYQALARMAREAGADLVLLAHHRRDQAETVVLQALRGAGPAGLSAMPRSVLRGGILFARPWLAQPTEALDAYAQRHRLRWVNDPSNADQRFARNRLRQGLWPALADAFPHLESALLGVAAQAQHAAAVLDEVAQADLASVQQPDGALSVAAWSALSGPRRRLALQHWMSERQGRGVSERALARLLDELPRVAQGCWPADAGLGQWRLYRGRLHWAPGDTHRARVGSHLVPDGDWPPAGLGGRWRVPGAPGGVWLEPVEEGGLPWRRVARAGWRVRRGGERLALGPDRPRRPLKKQFQAMAVPPWRRELPLLWDGDELLWVPGLGAQASALAVPGEPQVRLHWWSLDEGGG